MRTRAGMLRSLGRTTALLFAAVPLLRGQGSVVADAAPTLRVTTQIVLLDVAVVDKKGRPSPVLLQPDDFTVTEDGKPQRLLSFEPPAARAAVAKAVFVLDQLNTGAADRGYYAVCLEQYLRSQPAELPVATELMTLNSSSLKVVQPATRSRADLLKAVLHLQGSGDTLVNLEPELFSRTLSALELVAIQNLGEPGRTAVLWLGPGSGIDLNALQTFQRPGTERFIRYMINTVLESRTALYVIFPPDSIGEAASAGKGAEARGVNVANPYEGGVNFLSLAGQTGGAAYRATNDLATAMRNALELGRGSYSMSYHPAETLTDGSFRKTGVTVRDPALRVITKSGYYAPELQEGGAPQTIQVFQLSEAGKSMMPFTGLVLHVTHMERSLDAKSIDLTVAVEGKEVPWRPEGEDSLAELTVGGLSFSRDGRKLGSDFQNVSLLSHTQDAAVLQKAAPVFQVRVAVPATADHVRLVVSSRKNGRLGAVDIDRRQLSALAAPAVAAPPGFQ